MGQGFSNRLPLSQEIQVFLTTTYLTPETAQFQTGLPMIFFQGGIIEGIRMEELVDVIALGVVFPAGQLDQVIATINIIELFPSGLNLKVSGPLDL
jgi:hypothetical protein